MSDFDLRKFLAEQKAPKVEEVKEESIEEVEVNEEQVEETYHEGDGKDLGHVLEFKSEVQLSYESSDSTSFGVSYNHVSNASLGDKNPGANSYMFNLLKKF